jgi:hypothetical protein
LHEKVQESVEIEVFARTVGAGASGADHQRAADVFYEDVRATCPEEQSVWLARVHHVYVNPSIRIHVTGNTISGV